MGSFYIIAVFAAVVFVVALWLYVQQTKVGPKQRADIWTFMTTCDQSQPWPWGLLLLTAGLYSGCLFEGRLSLAVFTEITYGRMAIFIYVWRVFGKF